MKPEQKNAAYLWDMLQKPFPLQLEKTLVFWSNKAMLLKIFIPLRQVCFDVKLVHIIALVAMFTFLGYGCNQSQSSEGTSSLLGNHQPEKMFVERSTTGFQDKDYQKQFDETTCSRATG